MPATNLQVRIQEFLRRYIREFDYFQEVAKRVATLCDVTLQSQGIRTIVSHRAKHPENLGEKVNQRAKEKNYERVEDIYKDIKDLAGVRIALYFPSDLVRVDQIIKALFDVESEKTFPLLTPRQQNNIYTKRFDGYKATHYLVSLKDDNLDGMHRRYIGTRTEIQVASVLMHAWAEVEHDLAYKPNDGDLSPEEYAILDEINGLVMAGEIALERLQKAGEQRTTVKRQFSNHYELGAFLYDQMNQQPEDNGEVQIGNVNLLYNLLEVGNLTDPDVVKRYIDQIPQGSEGLSFAQKIMEEVLKDRPALVDNFVVSRGSPLARNGILSMSPIPRFILVWITIEAIVQDLVALRLPELDKKKSLVKKLEELQIVEPEELVDINEVQSYRNQMFHGFAQTIQDTSHQHRMILKLEAIVGRLSRSDDPEVRNIALRTTVRYLGQGE